MQPIKYHLAEDTIDRADHAALAEWLTQDPLPRLTMGSLTKEFEQKWSDWIGKKYSVFCNSGSSANLLMYYALMLSGRLDNKKVIVPSVGWVTSIAPAIQFGLEPIMCEAARDTFGLDLHHLESLLRTHEPATVMMVQVLGVPNNMEKVLALQQKYNFILLEDACAAMGSNYLDQKVGSFGDMASFSFYFGHQISTIEGGMVSTSDPKLHDLLLMLRSHGWSKDLEQKTHQSLVRKHKVDDFHRPFVFYVPGFNVRSTDLNAFLGIRQLDKMDWLIGRRYENHQLYRAKLGKYFSFQEYEPNSTICSIHFGLLAESPEQRRKIVSALVENGVETRIFSAGNLGLHPFWAERYRESHFPVADQVHNCGLFLPNNPSLGEVDIDYICSIVINSIKETR